MIGVQRICFAKMAVRRFNADGQVLPAKARITNVGMPLEREGDCTYWATSQSFEVQTHTMVWLESLT